MSTNSFRQPRFPRIRHPMLLLCLLYAAPAAPTQAEPMLSGFKHAVHNNRVYTCWQEQGDFDAVRVLIRSTGEQSETLVPWRNSARNHYELYHKELKEDERRLWPLPVELSLSANGGIFVHCPAARGKYSYGFVPLKKGLPLTDADPPPSQIKEVNVADAASFDPALVFRADDEKGFLERKPLEVIFHAIGGYADHRLAKRISGGKLPVRSYLHWHDHGARRGTPNQFFLVEHENRLQLWLDDNFRPESSPNKFCRTWWFGTNEFVHTPEKMKDGKVYPYTQRRVRETIEWVVANYPIDAERIYAYGSSMGGTGLLMLCVMHPDLFSMGDIRVPAVNLGALLREKKHHSYTDIWGPFDSEVLFHDGQKLDEYLDVANTIRKNPNRGYPFMRVYNGRNDPWMHWHFNPRFYKALNDASLARLVCWSDQGHSGDVERIMGEPALVDFLSFYRNKPVIGFKGLDNAPNPGNGDKTDGDPRGVIGRGFSTSITKDEKDTFEFVFKNGSDIGHIALTPRRCQVFAVAPKEHVQCSLLDGEKVLKEQTISTDDKGIVSIPLDFREFPNVQNAVVRLRRGAGAR